ncbi:carboxypeptidase-like regulatory domain-containing protein [Maribacter sp. 1_MG-2023]|uniref:carboxypeptidase-like regulatory domain-containing protein n=1 Tax=Maribacter sp. 1_MG-2023 TaxID=3062677 RepID=UPI0026E1D2DC|nr:carboxypeptidase-like regulatory domain-containing protein [Maribacter sp. 1_MG-2023]MDO6470627.1 carboxypeptidase-like regulatory domain-containing protein [Maribacter sp. 1_MG-2023]
MIQKNIFSTKYYAVKYVFVFLLFIGIGVNTMFAQTTNYTEYAGEVLDADSKRPLIFATLTVDNTNVTTITNSEGQFSLKVPNEYTDNKLTIAFLGYKTKQIVITELDLEKNRIFMKEFVMALPEARIDAPNDAEALVKETLNRKGDNYLNESTVMTAFYRETIKKRRTNVSLSEAVVNIYKTPYSSKKTDALELYKARKSTDYTKLDTVALKLQGGPFNTLFVDMVKYPNYIFTAETLAYYDFSFDTSTRVNDQLIYVIDFKQKPEIIDPLYNGKLYIDAENKILTSAIYSLNITDKRLASQMFVRRKPKNAEVWPTEVSYRVDYREKDGKWYYGYSNVLLEFKINWDKRLFNSVYSMNCEMAITDWEKNTDNTFPKYKDRMKSSIILSDEAIGFADPDFWGEYNIIEPEKSIESAIKKIQRQLRKDKSVIGGTAAR